MRSAVSDSLQPYGLCLSSTWIHAALSMGFPRQEHWSGLPCPSPGDLPHPGIKPVSPALMGSWPPTNIPVMKYYTVEILIKFFAKTYLPNNMYVIYAMMQIFYIRAWYIAYHFLSEQESSIHKFRPLCPLAFMPGLLGLLWFTDSPSASRECHLDHL